MNLKELTDKILDYQSTHGEKPFAACLKKEDWKELSAETAPDKVIQSADLIMVEGVHVVSREDLTNGVKFETQDEFAEYVEKKLGIE